MTYQIILNTKSPYSQMRIKAIFFNLILVFSPCLLYLYTIEVNKKFQSLQLIHLLTWLYFLIFPFKAFY